MDRRGFLRLAAGAAVATAGFSCGGSDSGGGEPEGARATTGPGGGERTLRIAQWSHFIPRYDAWFDDEYTRQWGEEHDVKVVVDHIPYAELNARAGAEVAAGAGHDLFAFITSPALVEDDVIDHREIVDEVRAKLGQMTPLVERNVFNPKTGRYFAFPEYWVANPVHYRSDLWSHPPGSWDDVLAEAPKLRAGGYPVGIGLSPDDDTNFSLYSLMAAFGSRVQDEDGRLAINSPETVEAVKLCTALYRGGMSDEVFFWDSSSNNRLLATGKGSLILTTISAVRSAEDQDPQLASQVALAPALGGPAARLGVNSVVNAFVIWRFAEHQDLAKQFLIDLALNYRDAFLRSLYYNLPAFPKAVPDLAELVRHDERARPADKYALLAEAESWTTNTGYPGHDNAATDEVFYQFIIPKMFAAAARGEKSPEEAVAAADMQAKPIFDKWRERGRI